MRASSSCSVSCSTRTSHALKSNAALEASASAPCIEGDPSVSRTPARAASPSSLQRCMLSMVLWAATGSKRSLSTAALNVGHVPGLSCSSSARVSTSTRRGDRRAPSGERTSLCSAPTPSRTCVPGASTIAAARSCRNPGSNRHAKYAGEPSDWTSLEGSLSSVVPARSAPAATTHARDGLRTDGTCADGIDPFHSAPPSPGWMRQGSLPRCWAASHWNALRSRTGSTGCTSTSIEPSLSANVKRFAPTFQEATAARASAVVRALSRAAMPSNARAEARPGQRKDSAPTAASGATTAWSFSRGRIGPWWGTIRTSCSIGEAPSTGMVSVSFWRATSAPRNDTDPPPAESVSA